MLASGAPGGTLRPNITNNRPRPPLAKAGRPSPHRFIICCLRIASVKPLVNSTSPFHLCCLFVLFFPHTSFLFF
ncbi:hypothetical protein BDV30DRAFT_216709 [Aspergillus minisclerotigenes]|uniref:Uncharacterized protein n=1 Tax=Aspergillus minisclerotigenes TaxID=656917 RepID=A0A5N6ITS2_9EURO|nr:hypothetical protein BDV30DRAFT_216709 [Aspergillus minisclerotigenes]